LRNIRWGAVGVLKSQSSKAVGLILGTGGFPK
jgi:hypothetical protein